MNNNNKRLVEYLDPAAPGIRAQADLAFPLIQAGDQELRTQERERRKTGQRGPLSPEATMVRGRLIKANQGQVLK